MRENSDRLQIDPPTDSAPRRRSVSSLLQRGADVLRRVAREPRLARESAWVVIGKLIEFGLLFATLKLTTNLMSQHDVGEYQLVQSILMVLAICLLGPAQHGYQRYFHVAEAHGERRAAGSFLFRWYGIATLSVALSATLLAIPLAAWLGIGVGVAILSGWIFLFDRWRAIALEMLEIRRERSRFAIQSSGHLLFHAFLLWLLLSHFGADTATALTAQALAGFTFAAIAVVPFVRMILAAPPSTSSGIGETVRQFGAPYTLLLAFQWIQISVDRFVIDQLLDKASVGLYVASYQICGVPFMLLVNIATWLVVPIAYQRARSVEDPAQLWSADKVLIGAFAGYAIIGFFAVIALVLAGPPLIVWLTSPDYEVPRSTVLALALGRYIQCFAFVLQPVFAVHKKMTSSLAFCAIGSALAIPICWLGVQWGGLFGAALAMVISGCLYLTLLIGGPNGGLWIVLGNRRAARGLNLAPRSDR